MQTDGTKINHRIDAIRDFTISKFYSCSVSIFYARKCFVASVFLVVKHLQLLYGRRNWCRILRIYIVHNWIVCIYRTSWNWNPWIHAVETFSHAYIRIQCTHARTHNAFNIHIDNHVRSAPSNRNIQKMPTTTSLSSLSSLSYFVLEFVCVLLVRLMDLGCSIVKYCVHNIGMG